MPRVSMQNPPSNVKDLLTALVRIPSVNPDGHPGVEHPGEAACAQYVAEFLQHIGAKVTLEEALPGRPNVVGVFPTEPAPSGNGTAVGFTRPKKRLVLAPHLDTVSVVGMTIDPFSGEERDGRIWGRGASDTKGPMAAMLWALWELRGRLPSLGHEIVFAGLVGEEAGQHGAKAFVKAHRADFALIGEPTEQRDGPAAGRIGIVHTHKGCAWLRLTTHGVAVHASEPQRGENAIEKMLALLAGLLPFIRRELPRWAGLESTALLGPPTVNLGTIAGGSKLNIVPDRCEAALDLRTVPAQIRDGFLEALDAEVTRLCPDAVRHWRRSEPLHTDPAHPVVRILQQAGGEPCGAPWFCDAAIFAEAGIPAVAAGPGSIRQAHTVNEWISVESLEQGVAFYKRTLAAV